MVQVRFANVDAPGLPNIPVIKSLITALRRQAGARPARCPPLPLKLKVQKVEPQADGLQFTAGASNVTLNSGGL